MGRETRERGVPPAESKLEAVQILSMEKVKGKRRGTERKGEGRGWSCTG